MLKERVLQPPSLWRGFMNGEMDAVRMYCRCDARLGYRGLVRNYGCSVHFQFPLVDYARFLGEELQNKRRDAL